MLIVRKFPSRKALATSIPFKRRVSRDAVSNGKNELYVGTTNLYAATAWLKRSKFLEKLAAA